jgi:hypothetical protein
MVSLTPKARDLEPGTSSRRVMDPCLTLGHPDRFKKLVSELCLLTSHMG